MIYVRTAKDLIGQLALATRSTASGLFTKPEMYYALNTGIRAWANRVIVPYVHTMSTDWVSTSYTTTLPSYIDPRYIRPQIETTATPYETDISSSLPSTFVTLPGWSVEPGGDGTWVVRLSSVPFSGDGRILFWKPPGEVPGDIEGEEPTVNTDSSTSITIDSTVDNIPDVGYIRIGSEWMQYAGTAWDGGTWTLSNLVRALFGTTQATHASSTSVYWGVPVDDVGLYSQLLNQAKASLYELYLSSASVNERSDYQWNARWFKQQADEFWPGYVSSWQPQLRIDTRMGLTTL